MGNWSVFQRTRRSTHWVSGLVLIGVGTIFLFDNFEYIDIGAWVSYWPFIIACVGAGRIIEGRSAAEVSKGGFMIFVAGWLYACLQHLWGLSFYNSWPTILIALGLRHIIAGLFTPFDNTNDNTPS